MGDQVESTDPPGVFCDGDECLAVAPEGEVLPAGWTVAVVEGRLDLACPSCTAWLADQH
jgi:hypothetical protein